MKSIFQLIMGSPKVFAKFLENLPFLPQILGFLCLQPPHVPVSPHTFKFTLPSMLIWTEYMKLLYKLNFFPHNFTLLIAAILALKLYLCCQKVDFSEPMITITAGHITFWIWLFINCIKSSSPLSNFTFQMDWWTLIYWLLAPCLTTSNSSGQNPSGLATRNPLLDG